MNYGKPIKREVIKLFNYNKLRGKIREKFGTQEHFANALGIGTTTLNSRLKSETYFNQMEILKAGELLGLTREEIDEIFFEENNGKPI
ncbi:DUF739 family protein [Peptoniphilus sp.]|jgi:hypothetical protein|uniref:DUF739 family protein n=1 Tax=Peptoniphilus sp. TaxID=1971214 RepID=UPI003D9209F4